MSNIIVIKKKKKNRINRNANGDGIVRLDKESTNALDQLLEEADGELSVKDLASALIKYAATNTIIKIEEGSIE